MGDECERAQRGGEEHTPDLPSLFIMRLLGDGRVMKHTCTHMYELAAMYLFEAIPI